MRGQPVALQSGNKRFDAVIYSRRDGCVGHGKKSYGNDEGAEAFVFNAPLHGQIKNYD